MRIVRLRTDVILRSSQPTNWFISAHSKHIWWLTSRLKNVSHNFPNQTSGFAYAHLNGINWRDALIEQINLCGEEEGFALAIGVLNQEGYMPYWRVGENQFPDSTRQ